jgi:hypothetical protein
MPLVHLKVDGMGTFPNQMKTQLRLLETYVVNSRLFIF